MKKTPKRPMVRRPEKRQPTPKVPKGGLPVRAALPNRGMRPESVGSDHSLAPGWTMDGLLAALGQTHRQYDGSYFAACPLDPTHTLTVTPQGGLICGGHDTKRLWAALESRRA